MHSSGGDWIRITHAILGLKVLLLTGITVVFFLLLLELAPLDKYHLRYLPEINLYQITALPLFVLYAIAVVLILREINPLPVVIAVLVIHVLTAYTYIIPINPYIWCTVLIFTLFIMATSTRLEVLTDLHPSQEKNPSLSIRKEKDGSHHLPDKHLDQPKLTPDASIVVIVILLAGYTGTMLLLPDQPAPILTGLIVLGFISVSITLILHTKEPDTTQDSERYPASKRWSVHEK